MTGEPLNHEEVLEAGRARGQPDGRPARRTGRALVTDRLTPALRDATIRWLADDPSAADKAELQKVLADAMARTGRAPSPTCRTGWAPR